MKPSRKYLFETTFDIEEPDNDAAQAAPEPTFTAAELEAAKQSAHADGMAAGLDQALRGLERQTAQALEETGRQLASLHERQTKSNEAVQRNALEVAVSVVRKLSPGIEARDGMSEVERVVVDSLQQVLDQPRVVIRVHDALMQALQGRLKAVSDSVGFTGQLVLIADDRLGPSDCRVEWADGGAERIGARIWSEIDAVIDRAFAISNNCLPAARAGPPTVPAIDADADQATGDVPGNQHTHPGTEDATSVVDPN